MTRTLQTACLAFEQETAPIQVSTAQSLLLTEGPGSTERHRVP